MWEGKDNGGTSLELRTGAPFGRDAETVAMATKRPFEVMNAKCDYRDALLHGMWPLVSMDAQIER